jgi:hypothetical protein
MRAGAQWDANMDEQLEPLLVKHRIGQRLIAQASRRAREFDLHFPIRQRAKQPS